MRVVLCPLLQPFVRVIRTVALVISCSPTPAYYARGTTNTWNQYTARFLNIQLINVINRHISILVFPQQIV